MGLVVKFDHHHQPSSVELDGKPIFVDSMTVEYRPNELAKVTMQVMLVDSNGLLHRDADGNPKHEEMVLYAVSKEAFDSLTNK